MSDGAKKRVDWQAIDREILAKLDLHAEATRLGVVFSTAAPNAKGWWTCHSIDKPGPQKTPSAGLNVGDGELRGRYKDFSSGLTCSFFVLAGKLRFGDWRTARDHYASQVGVDVPKSDEFMGIEKAEVSDLTPGIAMLYAKGKEGISVEAVFAAGGMSARWPRGLPSRLTNHLIAFPAYGHLGLDADPVAYHCVPQNPNQKVRIFRGKGNEEELRKTVALGGYGLIGVDGMKRLPEAEVVWFVEGITDLLALQSVLPPSAKHVVFTTGGCNCYFKPEWGPLFAGKDIRVVFDVGDADGAGQNSAKVWVSTLLPIGEQVRNVVLPLADDGGKNDLRAWLSDGHTYEDLLRLAATSPVAEPAAEPAITIHDALLANLGLTVIGEHEGTSKIEVFSERKKKTVTINDINKLTWVSLVQACGSETVDKYVHDGREEQPGKVMLKDVKSAIADAASSRLYQPADKFGAGVWEIDKTVVLVQARGCARYDEEDRVLIPFDVPAYGGKMLDTGLASHAWFDVEQLAGYVINARSADWSQAAFDELYQWLNKTWNWKYKPSPQVVTSLIPCTWLQSLWAWRPMVYVTGATDAGKSWLLSKTISRLFGRMCVLATKPTEAAIRQHNKHHSKVFILDEFEQNTHRQTILDMFRSASDGEAGQIKGTADQRGLQYRIKLIPWFGSIETGLKRSPDLNRFIVNDLLPVARDVRGSVPTPSETWLNDLGKKMLAIGIVHYREAARLASVLKSVNRPGVPGRVVENFATPVGMLAAIHRLSDDAARSWLDDTLKGWDFGEQESQDEVELLQSILNAEVFLDGGKRTTIDALLLNMDESATAALHRCGVARVKKRGKFDGERCTYLFLCHKRIAEGQLRLPDAFMGHRLDEYLLRLPGAIRDAQRLSGASTPRGVSIPWETVVELIGGGHAEDSEHIGTVYQSEIDPETGEYHIGATSSSW